MWLRWVDALQSLKLRGKSSSERWSSIHEVADSQAGGWCHENWPRRFGTDGFDHHQAFCIRDPHRSIDRLISFFLQHLGIGVGVVLALRCFAIPTQPRRHQRPRRRAC
uniref:Uncharacterized protein n=1 Tax=Physcomitrium patens TaxID=3218 RepID=A9SN96_PHYPA|nr:hypothetical protein PHYPA_010860 [Physcomitrium patens]